MGPSLPTAPADPPFVIVYLTVRALDRNAIARRSILALVATSAMMTAIGCGRIGYDKINPSNTPESRDGGSDAGELDSGDAPESHNGGSDAGEPDSGDAPESHDGGSDADELDSGVVPSVACDWRRGVTVGAPEVMTTLITTAAEQDPVLSPDGLTLYFARGSGSWETKRPTLTAPFGALEPSSLSSVFPSPTGAAHLHIASRGLWAVIHATWPGGVGLTDIWLAERLNEDVPFSNWFPVSSVGTVYYEFDPYLSPDALTLVYQSGLPGSPPLFGLYIAERPDTASPFLPPTRIANLESVTRPQSPSLTDDLRTLVFSATASVSDGQGFELYFATRSDPSGPFSRPQKIAGLNTTRAELDPFIRRDGCELFFARQAPPGNNLDIHRAMVLP
jgi:hypothetical protein